MYIDVKELSNFILSNNSQLKNKRKLLSKLADEIVDSFHDFDKRSLLHDLKDETYKAIRNKISMNPVIQSFQSTVNKYEIPVEYVNNFIDSINFNISIKISCIRVFCFIS